MEFLATLFFGILKIVFYIVVAIFAYGIGKALVPLAGYLFLIMIVIALGVFIFSLSPTIFYILLALVIVAIIGIIYFIKKAFDDSDDLLNVDVFQVIGNLFKSK